MTNKTPAQEALDDYKMRKSSGFNLEGMGAWVWQNESNLIAALKILHAVQGGEWKCVPVEPTVDMWSAGTSQFLKYADRYNQAESSDHAIAHADCAAKPVFEAMINAAPEIGGTK